MNGNEKDPSGGSPATERDAHDIEVQSAGAAPSRFDGRLHQIFFDLSDAEMSRIRQFGEEKSFVKGAQLLKLGIPAPGMFIVVSGVVRLTHRDGLGTTRNVADLKGRQFIAETSTLSGQPSLVDAHAVVDVTAILVPPDRLRALIIAEAELGERLVRSMILRRGRLIEKGNGPILVGSENDGHMIRLQQFLRRNSCPYSTIDAEVDSEAVAFLEKMSASEADLPLIIFPDGSILSAPTEEEIASRLGWTVQIDSTQTYDVVVVGAGPAGLATAVYAASEGLSVAVFDSRAPGGQAGASARIENYLGFPTGITGQALAQRAFVQAQKFGTRFAIPVKVQALHCTCNPVEVELTTGVRMAARTVVIASGAAYRRPVISRLEEFEGKSIYYWASSVEAKLCAGTEVVLVGGGNSAGQAVVFLAASAQHVHVLIRREGLEATMSKYLIDRIASLANVTVHVKTEIDSLEGENASLTSINCKSPDGPLRFAVSHLFLFTGADPNTEWLAGCGVKTDVARFVVTGAAPTESAAHAAAPLETSVAGVFAIGDVRAESTKRVAAAVGEGAQVVSQIHRFLALESQRSPNAAI
jgi:thioredoxin reductase (NADPH)